MRSSKRADASPPNRPSEPAAAETVTAAVWRGGARAGGHRAVAAETAVAFTYDGTSHAVMMATPADLEDFAVGFSLTEGIVAAPDGIASLDIHHLDPGLELRMTLGAAPAAAFQARRRYLAGPVGCGLCGIDSLAEALRPLPAVAGGISVSPQMIAAALAATDRGQVLNRRTHAVHAAALWTPATGLTALREDVGRHNALDKLAGGLARSGLSPAAGIVVLTSRLSVELVQKAAMIGAPVLVAVSAPTALALRTAEAAGITVVGVARADGFEVFTRGDRVVAAGHHVAS